MPKSFKEKNKNLKIEVFNWFGIEVDCRFEIHLEILG